VRGMRRPRWSSTLPKLAQITGPSSYHLAAPDLFRLWSVRWRRPQPRSGSGRVEIVRYGLLGLALTTNPNSIVTLTSLKLYQLYQIIMKTNYPRSRREVMVLGCAFILSVFTALPVLVTFY